MTNYKVGDKVHVEFDAVVTAAGSSSIGRLWTHTVRDTITDSGATHYVYLHETTATVIDPEPASWPPKVGDIWEAEGHEYFAYNGYDESVTLFPVDGTEAANLRSYGKRFFSNDDSLDDFKALKPRLIRRKADSSEILVNFVTTKLNGKRFT